MKLSELNTNTKRNAVRALRENYSIDLDLSRVDFYDASNMLKKVRTLMKEDQQSVDFDRKMSKHSYMKLVFMEQALSTHIEYLRQPRAEVQIVFENEEVDKSQVVLAAQDMVDNVQNMIEKISDMLVKELPALVSSMESDVGTEESKQFNDQATQALKSLQDALMQNKTALEGAVGVVTGQGGGFAPETEPEGQEDFGMDMEEPEMGAPEEEEEVDINMDMEPEEQEPELPVGRQKR